MFISFSLCHLQRFKGTEPIEEVTEQVKAVKIEEKPKEVKEVVDEVQLQDVDFCRCCHCWQFIFHLWPCTLTNFRCSCFSQGPPKYTKSVLKKGDKVNFPKKGETVSCWYTGSLEDGTVFDTNIPAGMTNEQFNSWECRASLFTTLNHSVFVVNANSNRLEWSSGLNLPSFLSAAARKKRQTKPLSFKAGLGRVIRGVSNDVFFFVLCLQTCFRFTVCHHLILCFSQWDEAIMTMSKGETARLEIEPEWAYGRKGVPENKYPFLWLSWGMSCKYVFVFSWV